MNEYLLVAVRGTSAYALSVDIAADRDSADPSVAQAILGSFQVTGGS